MVLYRLITNNLAASAIVPETLREAFLDALPNGAKKRDKHDYDYNDYDDNYHGYNDPGDVQPQTDSSHLASFNEVIAICCRLWQHCKCIEHINKIRTISTATHKCISQQDHRWLR